MEKKNYTHAGGVGLCQMAAHLAAIDNIWNGAYQLPSNIGLGLELKKSSIDKYIFPEGTFWKNNNLIENKLWTT